MSMKRLRRLPEKFDALELYSAVSGQQGYRIGIGDDLEDFKQRIGAGLKATLQDPNVLHGKRVEAMFAYVLGALGGCKYIKQEDGGAVFASTENFEIPDYRVVTNEGELLLIEVKKTPQEGTRFTLLSQARLPCEINRLCGYEPCTPKGGDLFFPH